MARGEVRQRVIILGAGGRDFHVFNILYRDEPSVEVVAFTAAQIPNIDRRSYPPELSGPLYPDGIEVHPEAELEKLIRKHKADTCVLAYSDLSESDVMRLEARVLASGADFLLPNPFDVMIPSKKLVVAVTAVRTGAGKSQVSHFVSTVLAEHKLRVVLVRHPMPYGDLKEQKVQRFASYEDLERHKVTIEEREEYEQHLKEGIVVYAGVNYEAILAEAELEADCIIWDGGNNDTPFLKPDLWICVADPLRPGHELSFYPGNVCFKAADVIVINKANTASKEAIESLRQHANEHNRSAAVVVTDSVVAVEDPSAIKGKRVVTIDDGPTLTHGGMATGAGKVAANRYGAELVDPRGCFKGSLRGVLAKFKTLGPTIPAMGYSSEQIEDLAATIAAVDSDAVLIATPMDLRRLINIPKPSTIVRYRIQTRKGEGDLKAIIEQFQNVWRASK